VAVLLGDGKGRFRHAPGSQFKVEMPMHLAALGDLNGDRKPDLVTAHDDSDLITILPNDGRGAFKGYEHHIGSRIDEPTFRRRQMTASRFSSATVAAHSGRRRARDFPQGVARGRPPLGT